jgi:hypothetical protein
MDNKPFSITPVYDRLLRGSTDTAIGLYHLQLATAAQLTRLHYRPGSIKTVKARLKDLADHGYIQADGIPTKFSRSPYYYALAQKGVQYLESAGVDINEAFRSNKEVNKHALFVEHTLEVNDLLISAALLKREDPRYHLRSFIHERVLKRYPSRVNWQDKGQAQTFTVIPDAFLDLHATLADGRQRRLPFLLEHDRGSEEQQHFKRRIRAYSVYLKTGAYQKMFATKAITILFTTLVGTRRLEQMREWTRAELTTSGDMGTVGNVILFATLTQPLDARQVWLTPQWYTLQANQPVALLEG